MEDKFSARWHSATEMHLKMLAKNGIEGVMVACSAGLDSTVLFKIIHNKIRHIPSIKLALCHVNYQLRGLESDQAQKFVERLGIESGTKVYVHLADPANRSVKNIQLWARHERYRIFEKFREKNWVIALGHHHDDLAENILMRIGQGCGPRSIAGMTVWQPPFWRPLLDLSKQTLVQWAEGNKLQHLEDGSNAKLIYSRNVIRHKVIPELQKLYPSFSQHLVRLSQQITTQVEGVSARHLDLVEPLQQGKCVNKSGLIELDKMAAFEIISDALNGFRQRLNYEIIQQCHRALSCRQKRIQIAPNHFWTVTDKHVAILPGEKSKPRQQQHRASLRVQSPSGWTPGGAETKWLQPVTTKQ